ncbi:hypothetical protein QTP88_009402 [Uroleucon formosanum]
MLHIGSEQQKISSPAETKKDSEVTEILVSASLTSSIVNAHASISTEHVLLSTAIVSAENINGIPESYLATTCFKRLTETCQDQYREASAVIVRDFYMDDFLRGAESKEKAAKLLTQLTRIVG